ncbi:MAG: AsnC family transcriptional regulator [Rhodobiaceae bacterium]|nr:AsnC family transcriptional regulator [Rhodobiaceae bacterium]
MTTMIDSTDRRIIARLQDGIGLEPRPFAPVAAELGLAEEDLLVRLRKLRSDGTLSRFGPMFNAERMGGAFCLCAMAVPEDRFEEVVDQVNGFDEVAHNYARDHRLNMWFVLATETPGGIEETARRIEAETGLAVLLLPKEAEFFVGLKVPA